MSIPMRLVIIGDSSTESVRKQVAENLSKTQVPSSSTSSTSSLLLPKGAISRPFFENSKDLATTIANGPSFVVAIESSCNNNDNNSQQEGEGEQKKSCLKNSHSLRYWWNSNSSTVEEATQFIINCIQSNFQRLHPQFCSSRSTGSPNDKKSFLTAIREGLASDGGLFTPLTINKFLPSQLDAICNSNKFSTRYADLALAVLEQLADAFELPPGLLSEMVEIAYRPESWSTASNNNKPQGVTLPVNPLLPASNFGGEHVYIAELFHGPTAAFKDFALQLFPQFFAQSMLHATEEAVFQQQNKIDNNNSASADASGTSTTETTTDTTTGSRYMILAATSGDTGVSAIRGFMNGAPHVKVMVLYPKDGVSPVQKQQMLACHGGNVFVVGVDADFDFCQTTVKSIFSDVAINEKLLKETGTVLSSANSINWGRLLPQIVYYFWIYSQLLLEHKKEKSSSSSSSENNANFTFDACVPTGNFGNILSGYFAKQLGVPIRRFILASNTNDVLCEFIRTGVYDISERKLTVTASPSIDILKASNVERFLYFISDHNSELVSKLMKQLETDKKFTVPPEVFARIKKDFVSYKCNENECATEVQDAAKFGIVLDPHTAVAVRAAKLYRLEHTCAENNFDTTDEPNHQRIPLVVLSTAHWAKFPDSVRQALEKSTFPAASESNKLAPGKVLGIYSEVVETVKKNTSSASSVGEVFVSEPLAKIFKELGTTTQITCSHSREEIVGMVTKFASSS